MLPKGDAVMANNVIVTEEAVKLLQDISDLMNNMSVTAGAAAHNLNAVYEENKDGLGAHAEFIRKMLQDLGQQSNDADEPVKKLALKLRKSALVRKNLIDNNVYQSGKGRSR